jgi:hypothetical protein
MNHNPNAQYYAELRSEANRLLTTLHRWFSPDQVQLFDELIDANEVGVAIEMMSEVLVKMRAKLDVQTVNELSKMTSAVSSDPDVLASLRALASDRDA